MQLFSLNVLGKSVAMDCATISTAWLCKPCFLTNSSLATMAHAEPSDVGLQENRMQRTPYFKDSIEYSHGQQNVKAISWAIKFVMSTFIRQSRQLKNYIRKLKFIMPD
jgi:hypothetical protein